MSFFRRSIGPVPVTVFCVLLLLAGCGGGDSGSENTTDTNNAPVADAGADQSVNDGASVNLDGSASSDSDGDALTYSWAQTDGTAVTLSDASSEALSFTAPVVAGGTSLTFELTVSDGEDESTDSVTITINDITAAIAALAPETTLGIRENIVITFDEAMDPASLTLGDDLGAISDGGTWSAGNTVLTIVPDELGAWESGNQSLAFSIDDASGNVTDVSASFAIDFVLDTFQAAEVVIGQADFTSTASGTGASNFGSYTEGGAAYDPATDMLYLPDTRNHRVLGFEGIPETNGAIASLVLGQVDFSSATSGTSATKFNQPLSATVSNGKLVVTDYQNKRVTIFDPVPQAGPGTIATVVGQADKDSSSIVCSRSGLDSWAHFTTPAGKLIVTDTNQHRTMIWNSLPEADGADAYLVLGQADFTSCSGPGAASALRQSWPEGGWSDDEKLVISDSDFDRILIWNSFPTASTDAPGIVLGQGDFTHGTENDDNQDGAADGTPTARTLHYPLGSSVISNGRQLLVADSGNNRVLVWNSFPTASFQAADVVLGQADFTSNTANDDDQDGTPDATPSARTFGSWSVTGVVLVRDWLIVTDASNRRYLVFRSQ